MGDEALHVVGLVYFFMAALFFFFQFGGWYLYYVKKSCSKSKFYLWFYYSLFPMLGIFIMIFISEYFSVNKKLALPFILSYGILFGFMASLIIVVFWFYKNEKEREKEKWF